MARLALFERAMETAPELGATVPGAELVHAAARPAVLQDLEPAVSAAAEFWMAADAAEGRRKYLSEAERRLPREQVPVLTPAKETAAERDLLPVVIPAADFDARAAPESAATARQGTSRCLESHRRPARNSDQATFVFRALRLSAISDPVGPMVQEMAALGTAAKEAAVKVRGEGRSRGQDRCRVEAAVLRLSSAVIAALVAASAQVRAPARERLRAASHSVREQLRKTGFQAKGQQEREVRAVAYPS
jgi:hypothetical protein